MRNCSSAQLKATSNEGWCPECQDRRRATVIHPLPAAALSEYSSRLATRIDENVPAK
ncbi:hypothetical protein [Streptomyces inhibens]|uniref:hypothetical protein n=1 Tax=Streptomyces inhibens TaxID=2293571 RepID=UPI001EE71187|nr:hypothetical protein [Streptomyces inhibens]UKY54661.1 hypothetical protein KI385_41600 [Streptomyces inhibens]